MIKIKAILVIFSLLQINVFQLKTSSNIQINDLKMVEISYDVFIEQKGYIEINKNESCLVQSIDELATTDTETNMVNYNISTKSLSFETFNPDFYCKRRPTIQRTNGMMNNNYMVEEVNINIGSSDMCEQKNYYSNEYLPVKKATCLSETIIGQIALNDNRQLIENPKSNGYLRVGQTVATYYNMLNNSNGKMYTLFSFGTGFMEGPNLMVTAGHCVYSDKTTGDYDDELNNPRFPDKLEFYPGINGTTELSDGENYEYYAKGLVVNLNVDYYLNRNADSDWAAIELDRNIGQLTGWYGKISNYYSVGSHVKSNGYPGDKHSTQWYSEGEITEKMNDFKIRTSVYAVGGQSGSPYHITNNNGNYVAGILTHSHSSDGWVSINGTSGVYFNNFIFHYLNSFVAHNGSGFTYTYTQLDALCHNRVCTCGETTTEAHTFKSYSNGYKCNKCRYFTTGPIIVGPLSNQ